jgi:hypothetical protein
LEKVVKLEMWDGLPMQIYDGAVLFTALNRYFKPEAMRVGPGGVRPVSAEPFWVLELVRMDIATEKKSWSMPLGSPADFRDLRLMGDTVVHARGSVVTHRNLLLLPESEVLTCQLDAYDARTGAPLWSIQSDSSIVHYAVTARHVAILTKEGHMTLYRRK